MNFIKGTLHNLQKNQACVRLSKSKWSLQFRCPEHCPSAYRYNITVYSVSAAYRNSKFSCWFSQISKRSAHHRIMLQWWLGNICILYIFIPKICITRSDLKSESETPCFSRLKFCQNLELHGHKKLPHLESSRKSGIVEPFTCWIFFCWLWSVPLIKLNFYNGQ